MTLQSGAPAADTNARAVIVLTVAIMISSGLAVLVLIPGLVMGVLVVLSGEGIGKLLAEYGSPVWLALAWIPAALLAAVHNIVLGRKVLKQPNARHLSRLLALSVFIFGGFAVLWYQSA